MVHSDPEALFDWQLRAAGLAVGLEREYKFHDVRRWRVDFAWPAAWLLVEIEGVSAEGTRHQRIAGFIKDLEKYNAAAIAGYRLLRFTPAMVNMGVALQTTEQGLRVARAERMAD